MTRFMASFRRVLLSTVRCLSSFSCTCCTSASFCLASMRSFQPLVPFARSAGEPVGGREELLCSDLPFVSLCRIRSCSRRVAEEVDTPNPDPAVAEKALRLSPSCCIASASCCIACRNWRLSNGVSASSGLGHSTVSVSTGGFAG